MSDYNDEVLPETDCCPKRETGANQTTPYGHDEAMRDINAIAYDDGCLLDRISNYIAELVQENKTWQQEYALLAKECDSLKVILNDCTDIIERPAVTR